MDIIDLCEILQKNWERYTYKSRDDMFRELLDINDDTSLNASRIYQKRKPSKTIIETLSRSGSDNLAALYQNKTLCPVLSSPPTKKEEIKIRQAIIQLCNDSKLNNIADFYKFLATSVIIAINTSAKKIETNNKIEIVEQKIKEYYLELFNTSNINYICIITQIGMILTDDEDITNAIISYLNQGKELKVIINTNEVRSQIGKYMRNSRADHQTSTADVLKKWETIKTRTKSQLLWVGLTEIPLLHQIIYSEKRRYTNANFTAFEFENEKMRIQFYAYCVGDKNNNLTLDFTPDNPKYSIFKNEYEFIQHNIMF